MKIYHNYANFSSSVLHASFLDSFLTKKIQLKNELNENMINKSIKTYNI